MKIEREGTVLVITLPPKGENERTAILSDLRGVTFTGWRGADQALYNVETFSEQTTCTTLRRLYRKCKEYNFEISDDAQETFEYYEERLRAIEFAKLEAEKKEVERKSAIHLMTHGCGTCIGLKLDPEKHGEFVCDLTGMRCLQKSYELEMGFDLWKEQGRFPTFTPYPMKECPKLDVLR